MSSSAASGSRSTPRRPSLPSSSSQSVLASADVPLTMERSALIKHGKYVAAGGLACWWSRVGPAVREVYNGPGGWVRKTLMAALGFHASTVVIFLYLVLFLPYVRGYIPHYPEWQKSARLRVIVPVLTASILLGWTSYVISLSQAGKRTALEAAGDVLRAVGEADLSKLHGTRGLGLLRSIVGATGLYTLTLGLLAFIQAPPNTPIRKKES